MAYEKIVNAALSETQSKFALAEALYEEIGDLDKGSLSRMFEEIARLIAAAGGERRSGVLLQQYWRTAQWAWNGDSYDWVPGASYGAHSYARQAGLKPGEFVELDSHTIDHIKMETVSTNMRRNRLDHDLARTLRNFANTVDRYMAAGVPPDMVHWSDLLRAFHEAQRAMKKVENYLEVENV